ILIIYVLDKHEKVVGVLSNEAPFSCPFFEDKHTENIRMGTHSFIFSVPASHEMASKIEPEGSVVFPNLDGQMQLFKIKNIEEEATEDSYLKHVTTEHTAISDLLEYVVRPVRTTLISLQGISNNILANTDYSLGEYDRIQEENIEIEKYMTALEAILYVAESFQVEIQFEVKLKHGRITQKLIHMKKKLGTVTNKLFTYSKDITEVKRIENSESLVTALIGIGKGDAEGESITLKNYNPESLPDDFTKKLEDDFIVSESAYQAYNRDGRHKFGVYHSDTAKDKKKLTEETVKELKARCVPF